MNRGWVLLVLLLASCMAVDAATPFVARWETELYFEIDPITHGFDDVYSWSELAFELHVEGWTFASLSVFDTDDGLYELQFAGTGTVGAFEVLASAYFDAEDLDMEAVFAARLEVSGIDLWAVTTVESYEGLVGSASLVGFFGSVGDIEVFGDVSFNMNAPVIPYMRAVGFEHLWHALLLCDLVEAMAPSCETTFSYADFWLTIPFACLDIDFLTTFSCTYGFEEADFWISDLDLGLDWLRLESLGVVFEVDDKTVYLDFDTVVLDAVCIQPFISVLRETEMHEIDGLTLNAIELTYTLDGVTLIVSELFYDLGDSTFLSYYYIGEDARIHYRDYGWNTSVDCTDEIGVDEAIGIEIDGDSCCGAAFAVGIYTFFDTTLDEESIFDWAETYVVIDYGFSPEFSFTLYADFHEDGDDWYGFGFEFLWGDLSVFGPEWWNGCCSLWWN